MTNPTTQREADERCACGTHTKRACDLAGVCGQNVPAPRVVVPSPDERVRFMAYCDYAIDGTDTIDRDWLFHFCTNWQARAALAQSEAPASDHDYRIGVSVEPNGTFVQVWDGEECLHKEFYEMPGNVTTPEAPAISALRLQAAAANPDLVKVKPVAAPEAPASDRPQHWSKDT